MCVECAKFLQNKSPTFSKIPWELINCFHLVVYENSSLNEPRNWRQAIRLRAVSYFSLQSYYTQNLSTRAAKSLAARNEGVSPRRKNKRPVFSRLVSIPIYIITSWYAIVLNEIKNYTDVRRKGGLQAVYQAIGYMSEKSESLVFAGVSKTTTSNYQTTTGSWGIRKHKHAEASITFVF